MKKRKEKISGLMVYQVEELRAAWVKLCEENYARMGDSGTCVIGAGLEQNGVMVVSAREATGVQGCLVWESGLQKLLDAFNKKHGTNVRYEAGRMD